MKLIRTCKTCEFNFDGFCGDGGIYSYNQQITDDSIECPSWEIGLEYFSEVTQNAPWYIKQPYDRHKINFSKFIELIDKDAKGEPIEINLYDAIEKTFGLRFGELAEILEVSYAVVGYARERGTVEKRRAPFASKLRLPIKYFHEFTSLNLADLENKKAAFMKAYSNKIDFLRKQQEEEYSNRKKGVPPPPMEYMIAEIEKYEYKASIYDGAIDDYKSWNIVLRFVINADKYSGSIYHQFTSNRYISKIDTREAINDFFAGIDCEQIDDMNEDGWLINTIELYADPNEQDVHFTLRDKNSDILVKTVPIDDLPKLISKVEIVRCEGSGKKKERRMCIQCKHFHQLEGSAKGHCDIRKDTVQRSRIICAFDFETA